MKRRSLVSDALKRHGIEAVPDDTEVNILSGRRFEEDMGKTLKEEAEAWCRANDAANCVDVWLAGYGRALANIEPDEGDLHGCCADYAELESEGGGTQGLTLKDMLFEAYYEGVKLAVERIKEGKWVKK